MNREEELALIDRCYELYLNKSTTLADAMTTSSAQRYLCMDQFKLEQQAIFQVLPSALVHVSELKEKNSFKKVKCSFGTVIVTRDEQGMCHVFHNICRHRGAQVVTEESGCSSRLTCPYHAWSYSTDGTLKSVPAEEHCFTGLEKSQHGLKRIPCVEKYGFVWMCPAAADAQDAAHQLDEHLGEMRQTLAWLNLENHYVFKSKLKTWRCNWKILAEGALENYHFARSHQKTIAPFFVSNTMVVDCMNGHHRVVFPTKAISSIIQKAKEEQNIRQMSHMLLSLMPQSSFLAQENHVDWIRVNPISENCSEIYITSLIPRPPCDLSISEHKHWSRNFSITFTTLAEDFVIGEGIQRSLETGQIEHINFGRNEGALKSFNEYIDRHCGNGLQTRTEPNQVMKDYAGAPAGIETS